MGDDYIKPYFTLLFLHQLETGLTKKHSSPVWNYTSDNEVNALTTVSLIFF
uniref:Uncharacterized protein n=1 Tax=Arion vulgaris TaxID=1028688 RepID=A0A0B7B296_9EUPU